MARIAIDDIAHPPAEYRVWRGRNAALSNFDHRREKIEEDRRRMAALRALANRDRHKRGKLRRVARRIAYSMRQRARSLASATYMRNLRQRVSGQVWSLFDRTRNLNPRTFTLFPRGWEVPAGQLHRFNPQRKLNALRSLINRSGGGQADGYLLAVIHGEFEPGRQVYQLHVHCLAAGGLRDVVDKAVRKTPTVRVVFGAYGVTDFVRFRLRMDGEPTNLPSAFTYLVKSYWVSRLQYRNAQGMLRRSRWATRIPEPHHSEVLLWLDQWRLADLTLLMNISVGREGFCLSDRAYPDGGI
jgi:hypothetical protein